MSKRAIRERFEEEKRQRAALEVVRRPLEDVARDALLEECYDAALAIIDEVGLSDLREVHAVISRSKRAPVIYPSIMAARRGGFVPLRSFFYGGEWISIATRGKHHFLLRDPVEAISATAWHARECEVIEDAVPHARRTHQVGGGRKSVTYNVYREDQVRFRAPRALKCARS